MLASARERSCGPLPMKSSAYSLIGCCLVLIAISLNFQFSPALAAPAGSIRFVLACGHVGYLVVILHQVFLLPGFGIDDDHPVAVHITPPRRGPRYTHP